MDVDCGIGIGVDIIEVARIGKALQRLAFRHRVYSDAEQVLLTDRPVASWAGRFAAKEAVMKALGCGWGRGVGFTQIEVLADAAGKPTVVLQGKAAKIAAQQGVVRFAISISHTKDYAVAFAIATGGTQDVADCNGRADATD